MRSESREGEEDPDEKVKEVEAGGVEENCCAEDEEEKEDEDDDEDNESVDESLKVREEEDVFLTKSGSELAASERMPDPVVFSKIGFQMLSMAWAHLKPLIKAPENKT